VQSVRVLTVHDGNPEITSVSLLHRHPRCSSDMQRLAQQFVTTDGCGGCGSRHFFMYYQNNTRCHESVSVRVSLFLNSRLI
jgi:hypothetical protein